MNFGAEEYTVIGIIVVAAPSIFALGRMVSGRAEKRELQQPLRVQAEADPFDKRECEARHRLILEQIHNVQVEAHKRTDELRSEIKTDLNGVFRRINDVQHLMSEQGKSTERSLGRIEGLIQKFWGSTGSGEH